MIFNNSRILNTPALQVLGAVKADPRNYNEHYDMLLHRLYGLYLISEAQEGREATCAMITELLGPDGLTECATMEGAEIVETAILESSPGAALLTDLRERWKNAGTYLASTDADVEEYESITLRSWLESLVSEYRDI